MHILSIFNPHYSCQVNQKILLSIKLHANKWTYKMENKRPKTHNNSETITCGNNNRKTLQHFAQNEIGWKSDNIY